MGCIQNNSVIELNELNGFQNKNQSENLNSKTRESEEERDFSSSVLSKNTSKSKERKKRSKNKRGKNNENSGDKRNKMKNKSLNNVLPDTWAGSVDLKTEGIAKIKSRVSVPENRSQSKSKPKTRNINSTPDKILSALSLTSNSTNMNKYENKGPIISLLMKKVGNVDNLN